MAEFPEYPSRPAPRPPEFGRGRVGLLLISAGVAAPSLVLPEPGPTLPGALAVQPPRGPVGARVVLEGRGLSSVSSVRFGSLPATFRVLDDRRVEVQVPAGTRTGPITLTTGEGELFASGADFQVVPAPSSGPGA